MDEIARTVMAFIAIYAVKNLKQTNFDLGNNMSRMGRPSCPILHFFVNSDYAMILSPQYCSISYRFTRMIGFNRPISSTE